MAFDVFYFVDKHHLLNVLDHETVESMHQLVGDTCNFFRQIRRKLISVIFFSSISIPDNTYNDQTGFLLGTYWKF